MHAWHPVTVTRPRGLGAAIGIIIVWVGILLYLGAAWLFEGCTPVNPCRVVYLFDGRTPDPAAGVRPYYALRECDGAPAVDLCDDYTRLPTPKCSPKD